MDDRKEGVEIGNSTSLMGIAMMLWNLRCHDSATEERSSGKRFYYWRIVDEDEIFGVRRKLRLINGVRAS